ncbi:Phytochrome-like protein cph1 [Acaryochloris thomasi RCC1774]|uniref:histidine kinase n=1 Tax=Acaryochloris thomasi RCC1774 TaxID=1764569 RepID=A0A2W1K3B3_9CYAN|nr:PAS domain S-box protein [Acaryochloris thomasi]PZD74457.1 Phytochrome-like protein cph1 [Acaryochloris thomasi RCC1774]
MLPQVPFDLASAMIRDPLVVSPQASTLDAITLMHSTRSAANLQSCDQRTRSSCVLAIDNEQVVGILTQQDVVRLSVQQQPLTQRVQEVMTQPLVTLQERAGHDLQAILSLLEQHQIHHLPILNEHHGLVGLVTHASLSQILNAAKLHQRVESLEQEVARLQTEKEHIIEERTAELQVREKFLQTVLDTFPLSVFWKDRNSVFVGCNHNFLSDAGLSSMTDILGKTDYDMPWSRAEASAYRVADQEVMDSDTPKLGIVETQIQADGRQRWLEVNKIPLHNLRGGVVGVLGTYQDITPRKQAEQAMKQQLAAIEAAVDGIAILESDNYLYANRAHLELFGYERLEDLLGQTWKSLYPPEELARFEQKVFPILERDRAWQGEVTALRKNGLTFAEGLSLTLTDDGLLICVCRDISDRKRAEAALQESEARFRYLTDNAPVLIWMAGPDKMCSHVNQRWLDFTGQLMEEQIGVCWLQRVHPDEKPLCLETYLSAFEARQGFEIEHRLQRFDGEYRWLLNAGVPRFDVAGEFLGYIGSCVDISDRKQAEDHLRQLSTRLNLAVESANIGIWEWDITHNHLIWDARMHELYDTPLDAFSNVYDAWVNRLHPDDLALAETVSQQALQGEKEYDTEFRVVHTDGAVRCIKANALVQHNSQGEAQRMIGINYDITDRQRAEEQIRRYTTQLEASNRELESFSYSVSHDLRGPLRAIDGFSQALLEDCGDQLDQDGQDYLGRIRKNIDRMGTLIDDLLRLSRVSRSEIRYATVNLSHLAQEIVHELHTLEPERRVNVVIAPNAQVSADATLMRIVLTNLLQNAWKFTSHRSVAQIEFGFNRFKDKTVYFIRDNGAGFDMAYAKMLFGVFQRLHSAHEFPGTGIGLATVQRTIHRHGGTVWAEGAVNKGATISFTVPNPSLVLGA